MPGNARPELLSPAGNWDCARAAVANGADAIYFGMPRFNARLRADNFTEEDLPELMKFLHAHGVKGYVAFNTLIFTKELPDAETQLRLLEDSGVDAVIVQDLGLARMVKALTPNLRLHASTQMTITSPEGLEFAKQLDIDQAVLARELSIRELERFKDAHVPLEVFVHGALCVAYSGQCLTSESLGRRSANRGECAQACRMPYEMIVDGDLRDLGDKRYLLSPQDLAAVDEIPRLIELGIRSFKIEGRLKTPEYVAGVTQVYRAAIDRALAGKPAPATEDDRYALEMTFSRGLSTGWMHGVNHQELVGAYYGKKRGPYVGSVTRIIDADTLELDSLQLAMKPGDGVVFENLNNTNDEQGGSIYEMRGSRLSFRHGHLRMEGIPIGTRVFKTSDPTLNRALRQSFEGEIPIRKQSKLNLVVTGTAGEPLRVCCGDLVIESTMPLQTAMKRPLTPQAFIDQFSRLGGTEFELGSVQFDVVGEVILPVSELNRMRRELIASWSGDESSPDKPLKSITTLESLMPSRGKGDESSPLQMFALCRTRDQIDAALEAGVPRLYLDFEDIRLYADLLKHIKDRTDQSQVWLATPRIQKSGEAGFFKLIQRAEPHGVLIRNLGAIAFFRDEGIPVTGDFSLNVANPLTAEILKKTGLERLTISYDLNIEQVVDLLASAPPSWFELTLHQHMPMFHMEHCAFAAFLSEGTDFTNCGRPCEKHRVHLRDRVGMAHPLKADVGCRNTLFNAVPQTGAQFFSELRSYGLSCFRVELLEEDKAASAEVLRTYQELLAGNRDEQDIWRDLKAQSQLGVTRGTMAELP
ncbi:MAG: U32 family peptidase [Prosthecobacter sp.]|uniref:U32 family peptidase n=1 Tax=Prosthecobacter sp. TaxID=1965333 RepID=UPI001A0B93F5|nr:U32 family peptidase [Prosthecobacter sp.]MBE2284524.1 U32 family peptidase [Prosthecobacter sp.]